jgi:general secretion pathway protein C
MAGRAKGVLGGALAPRVAEILLVILLGAILARAAWSIFAPLEGPQGDAYAALSTNQLQRHTAQVVKSPFPKAEIAAAPVDQAPEVAETALDLTLTGVWAGDDNPSAIIRRPDGTQKSFEVGNTIINGVTLVAVYADQVIIEQNGARESLRFETKARASQPARLSPEVSAAPAQRNLTLADLQKIFSLRAAQDSSGQPAVAIFAGSNRTAFDSSGLRNGDILKSINGAPPPLEPAAMARLMNDVARTGAAEIVVERGGTVQSVSLSFKELGTE